MPVKTRFDQRLSVPLRKVDLVRLDLVARQRDVPRTQIVREALRDYLARAQAAEPRAS